VNLNQSENPLDWLEEEAHGDETLDEDVDADELLQSQLDELYDTYKERKEIHEKKYLQELEKKKGLPAQKKRELVCMICIYDYRENWMNCIRKR
jgi:hypothetical protein